MPVTATSNSPTILANLPIWTLNEQTRVNESYLEHQSFFPQIQKWHLGLDALKAGDLYCRCVYSSMPKCHRTDSRFYWRCKYKIKCDLKDQGENDKTRSSGVYVPCWSSRSHVNYHRECRAGKAPGPVSRALLIRSAVQFPLYPLYPMRSSNGELERDSKTGGSRDVESWLAVARSFITPSQSNALDLINWNNWRAQRFNVHVPILFVHLYYQS